MKIVGRYFFCFSDNSWKLVDIIELGLAYNFKISAKPAERGDVRLREQTSTVELGSRGM